MRRTSSVCQAAVVVVVLDGVLPWISVNVIKDMRWMRVENVCQSVDPIVEMECVLRREFASVNRDTRKRRPDVSRFVQMVASTGSAPDRKRAPASRATRWAHRETNVTPRVINPA